jgi:DNA helicase HerA-like ATPase
MSHSPFLHVESLSIGKVDSASPGEITAILDIEAPESMAINTGSPRPFPRIHGYVLIAVDDCFLVGQIGWLTVHPSPYPKRRGAQDHGLVDLPYPLRKLSLNPVGTLRAVTAADRKGDDFVFSRGAESFPSIGANVLIPTDKQLKAIIESGKNRRIKIGTSPLAANTEVCVDPDRLFGRHLAVMGNTGSGKSCSVAGLVRWSIEAATKKCKTLPNMRFVILDPNGEYAHAFQGKNDPIKARVFKVKPTKDTEEAILLVPLWFWNSSEWCSFSHAKPGIQQPILKRALRDVKSGRSRMTEGERANNHLRRFLTAMRNQISHEVESNGYRGNSNKTSNFGILLHTYSADLTRKINDHPSHDIGSLALLIETSIKPVRGNARNDGGHWYGPIALASIEAIIAAIGALLLPLGGELVFDGPDEDIPVPFSGKHFVDYLEELAKGEQSSHFLEYLVTRIRTLIGDKRAQSIIDNADNQISLLDWLEGMVGDGEPYISVIDLSLVPAEIVHVISAVIARILFESLQRYRQLESQTLPTVLVIEEAHTFARRYKEDADFYNAGAICCQVFEKIAREGRKFGLGLVLSSQRPSELSQTVLSQCNTFLIHRISNDSDQDSVHRLVPDNLRGLLRELPTLPSQYAMLLGWAAELPMLVKMNDLLEDHRPHSDDPDFWSVWVRYDDAKKVEVQRPAKWAEVVEEWLKDVQPEATEEQAEVLSAEAVDPLSERDAEKPEEDIPF